MKCTHFIANKIRFPRLFTYTKRFYNASTQIAEYYKQFPIAFNIPNSGGFVKLENRAIMKIQGVDSTKFIQNLTSNDIKLLETGKMQANVMMNPKGRVLADLLIAKEDEESYTLEFDKAIYEKMKQHIKRYKIRAKVDLIDQNETNVFVLLDAFQQIPSEKEALQIIGNDKLKIFKDPRLPTMGYRIYSSSSSPEFSDACKQVDTIEYDKIRIMNGVAEGSIDVEYESSFPLEINYEFLHGINLHKGCYLGQELTARTYYRGEQRRRLLPIFVEPNIKLVPGQEIFLKEGDVIQEKSIGKIRSSVDNIALAKLRIHEALEKSETSMLVIEGETKVIPIQPYWMLFSRN